MNALAYILTTGDFPGYATTGLEEDHPLVVALLAAHELLSAVGVL